MGGGRGKGLEIYTWGGQWKGGVSPVFKRTWQEKQIKH